MKTIFSQYIFLLALCMYLIFSNSISAKDVFIKPNAIGTGVDWDNAANISYLAGSSIIDGDVIYLAAGEYLRTTALTITKYVTIIGGYPAFSTSLDLTGRNTAINRSVFKPDVGSTTRAININATTAANGNKITLDGLYFDGFNGISQGAAMTITTAQSDIDLKNLTFTNNAVTNTIGGALAMQTAFAFNINITLDSCTFEGNQAKYTTGNGYGGAIYFNNGTTAKTINIKNTVFKNNTAYGRGAAGYFGTNMTVNVSDCTFDSNQCTVATDNTSNGGCFYIVGASGYGSTYNITNSIFLNGSITGKGSVIWFNNTTGSLINNLNMTNCSLIGNYSSRTTSSRAAIDVDNYTTQLQFKLDGCVLSNYNNFGGIKQSKYADVMFVAFAFTANTSTFANSIVNGTYFKTGDALKSITPPDTLYNKVQGYLADSTIALALSSDLKITDKIVFKKTFTAANLGTFIHAQIFDVKAKMNFPMTLLATIPSGYILTVDGIDYSAGEKVIDIPASATNPLITLSVFVPPAIPVNHVFIKPYSTGTGTGINWENAADLNYLGGLTIADGDVIHLLAGEYLRSTQLNITKYVTIKGGYSPTSTGTDLSKRDLIADSTIFVPVAYNRLRCIRLDANTNPGVFKFVLDGLHFKGFTTAQDIWNSGGAALYVFSSLSDIEIKNASFKNNIASNANGGAVYIGVFDSTIAISLDSCNFIGNQATFISTNGNGGAIYINNTIAAKTINIKNSTFKNNSAYVRAGAVYFTTNLTVNIDNCTFDSNQLTHPIDGNSSGGCFFIAGGTTSSTFNVNRTIFTNNYCNNKGSVFWFNTSPLNYLNLSNCSLIGNYSSRTTSPRAAIDVDNYLTNLNVTVQNCVLSNYNWSVGAKASNKADVMNLVSTSASNSSTFSNSIINGVYFATGNTFDAVSPTMLYTTTSYFKDSTIALALTGDLKITDKIVFKKTFTPDNVGDYIHAQIFDVKKEMGLPMTLQAAIPTGYKLTVDGVDYSAGDKSITIAASANDPIIKLVLDRTTGNNIMVGSKINLKSSEGKLLIVGLSSGEVVSIFNANGQLINKQIAKTSNMQIPANGLVIVKINSFVSKILVKK